MFPRNLLLLSSTLPRYAAAYPLWGTFIFRLPDVVNPISPSDDLNLGWLEGGVYFPSDGSCTFDDNGSRRIDASSNWVNVYEDMSCSGPVASRIAVVELSHDEWTSGGYHFVTSWNMEVPEDRLVRVTFWDSAGAACFGLDPRENVDPRANANPRANVNPRSNVNPRANVHGGVFLLSSGACHRNPFRKSGLGNGSSMHSARIRGNLDVMVFDNGSCEGHAEQMVLGEPGCVSVGIGGGRFRHVYFGDHLTYDQVRNGGFHPPTSSVPVAEPTGYQPLTVKPTNFDPGLTTTPTTGFTSTAASSGGVHAMLVVVGAYGSTSS